MVLSLQLNRTALRREPDCRGPAPGADGRAGHYGAVACGSRGLAGACPARGDREPQGEVPVALEAWPLWDRDGDQP